MTPNQVKVTFVEPCPADPSGFSSLGTYPMFVPPRRNEVVSLQPTLGGFRARFRVLEVIHHLPPMGMGEESQVLERTVSVVLHRVVRRGDLDRLVHALCDNDA